MLTFATTGNGSGWGFGGVRGCGVGDVVGFGFGWWLLLGR